jgi:hypothetical protein
LKDWVLEERRKGLGISTPRLLLQAKSFAETMNIDDFSGHHSLVSSFMKRNEFSVRASTTVGQNFPGD